MVWELPSPWDVICLLSTLAGLSVLVFWMYFSAYWRISGKAVKLALMKTVAWLIVYGGSFGLVFGLIAFVLPPGWLRYLVGGTLWWVLSQTVVALAWEGLNRLLDNLLFG